MGAPPPRPQEADGALLGHARPLVSRAGGSKVLAIHRIVGGRNNRAYRVDTSERPFFLKAYHSDPDDPRPRLQTELAFLRFARDCGIRCVPEPLASDEAHGIVLYSFVEGRRLEAAEIGREHLEQAARLIEDLNQDRGAAAQALPIASEACFAFATHLKMVGERVQRVDAIDGHEETARAARALVSKHLRPKWQEISRRVHKLASDAGLLDAGDLPTSERCVSPSDFGFHNAIAEPSGRLVFHDFEYAGWDDPAKMVCDFVCQPDIPVPTALADLARESLLSPLRPTAELRQRVDLLRPVYQVKWACICLNEFLPAAGRRRRFAASLGDAEKAAQLAKARQLLDAAAAS